MHLFPEDGPLLFEDGFGGLIPLFKMTYGGEQYPMPRRIDSRQNKGNSS